MNDIKHFLYVAMSLVVGGVFGYALQNVCGKMQVDAYIYQGRIMRNLNLPVENGVYKPEASVLNLEGGVVSDSNVAGNIGYSILKNIYGYDDVCTQLPFLVEKDFQSWIVSGSGANSSPYQLGGVASIVIDRKTGMIIEYSHGK